MVEAILSLGGLGLVAGLGLGIASRVFAVKIDPKVASIEEALLGTNCGACGFPGCGGLANAIASGNADITACLPGGEDVVNAVAEILGIEASEVEKEIAIVLCKGGHRDARKKFEYMGVRDCWAATQVGGGFKSCSYGCLGLASCVKACEYDAIEITEDGLAIIIPEKCTGCTMCVVACPKNLIKMVPEKQKVHVLCNSFDKGPVVKKVCDVGCVGCTLCTKKATNMTMENSLAIMDYSISDNSHESVEVCPTNSISDFNEAHPLERFKREKKKPAKKEPKKPVKAAGDKESPKAKAASGEKTDTEEKVAPTDNNKDAGEPDLNKEKVNSDVG